MSKMTTQEAQAKVDALTVKDLRNTIGDSSIASLIDQERDFGVFVAVGRAVKLLTTILHNIAINASMEAMSDDEISPEALAKSAARAQQQHSVKVTSGFTEDSAKAKVKETKATTIEGLWADLKPGELITMAEMRLDGGDRDASTLMVAGKGKSAEALFEVLSNHGFIQMEPEAPKTGPIKA